MELLQLRYFYESAKNENFSHTADKYVVSPSSVSISIKKLEKELGCDLFDRSGNKIKLNTNGHILQKALATALGDIDRAIETISASDSEQQGEIRLLVRSERKSILEYIYQFRQEHPNVVFHISHDFKTENTDVWDFIIDEQTSKYHRFVGTPIIKEPIRLAACADNPLCERTLFMSDLKNEPFITMCSGSSLHRITNSCCRQAGFIPNIIIESDDPQYITSCLEMDFGLAFVPEFSWRGRFGKNTRFLDVADFELTRVTCVYRNQTRVLSDAATAFFRGLTEMFHVN